MKRAQLIIIAFSFSFTLQAQYHQAVLPDLEGQALLDRLQNDFTPAYVFSWAAARDTLFGAIDAVDNVLSCVYTGYTVYLNPNEDPTQAAFEDGEGINTEHTWPQAYGADSGKPKSDMHHLYPTRVVVNGDRDNDPYGEIPDAQTDTWYYLNQEGSAIPNNNINLYSEARDGLFEPREDRKGDIARSMFYFNAIYRQHAQPYASYFESQRITLCQWNLQDPVDEREWQRTWRIADYQDGKPNPFVLDCSLAERTFCTNLNLACEITTSTQESLKSPVFDIQAITPNPFIDETQVSLQIHQTGHLQLHLFDVYGRQLKTIENTVEVPGTYTFTLDRNELQLSKGMYVVSIQVRIRGEVFLETRKIVLN